MATPNVGEQLFRVDRLHVAPAASDADAAAPAPPSILNGLDLVVNAGEVHAIMGPNGSGKSTLASTLMGSPVWRASRYSGAAERLIVRLEYFGISFGWTIARVVSSPCSSAVA